MGGGAVTRPFLWAWLNRGWLPSGGIRCSPLENFEISLSCNGELREVGRGPHVLRSPLIALAHLVSVLSKQPESSPLQADEIVTTGTITTAQSVRVGESWRTNLNDITLPDLAVELVP